jgi:hypothetical protein
LGAGVSVNNLPSNSHKKNLENFQENPKKLEDFLSNFQSRATNTSREGMFLMTMVFTRCRVTVNKKVNV